MLIAIRGEIKSSTIIVANFKTQLTPMDRSIMQKISNGTQP